MSKKQSNTNTKDNTHIAGAGYSSFFECKFQYFCKKALKCKKDKKFTFYNTDKCPFRDFFKDR